mgnify:CR=1 FL=1
MQGKDKEGDVKMGEKPAAAADSLAGSSVLSHLHQFTDSSEFKGAAKEGPAGDLNLIV